MTSEVQATQWWLARDGKAEGPYSEAYIETGLQTGTISPYMQVCPVGGQEWSPISAWPQWSEAAHIPLPPESSYHSPLTNARLPAMANWICIYTILVSPVLWFLYNFSCLMTGLAFHEDSSLFGLELGVNLLHALFSLGATALLFFGGLRLRALRRSGPTMILIAGWSCIGIGCLMLIVVMGLMIAAEESDFAESTAAGDVITFLELLIGLFEFAFLLMTLFWLHRHSQALPLTDP